MRLLIPIALSMLCVSAVHAAPVTPQGMRALGIEATATDCPPMSRFDASRNGGKLVPQKLNELPAADMYRAVLRSDGRCQVPVIVRYNVGGR
jgi:hypothetical protein